MPTAQLVHAAAPPAAYSPALHAVQAVPAENACALPAAHAWHATEVWAPGNVEKFPEPQSVQAAAPVAAA